MGPIIWSRGWGKARGFQEPFIEEHPAVEVELGTMWLYHTATYEGSGIHSGFVIQAAKVRAPQPEKSR